MRNITADGIGGATLRRMPISLILPLRGSGGRGCRVSAPVFRRG